MRIVNRLEFLKMPPGTVYAEYEPRAFGEISVKGATWWNDGPDDPDGVFGDFIYCDLTNEFPIELFQDNTLDRIVKTGEDLPLTFGEETSRDGLYEPDQLYAVWSREDILGLAAYLLKLCGSHVPDTAPINAPDGHAPEPVVLENPAKERETPP